ncbi:MAG: hypothetical protein R3F59_12145 [Myxococcota bacterium]
MQAERQQARGEDPADPDRDGRLRSLRRDREEIPPQQEDHQDEKADLGEAREDLEEEQAEVQEELQAAEEALRKAQPRGGGGGGPAPEPSIKKTSAKLAGLLRGIKPKLQTEHTRADRDVKAAKKALDDAKTARKKLDTEEADAKAALEQANGSVQRLTGAVAARKAELDDPKAHDAKLASLQAQLGAAGGRVRKQKGVLAGLPAKKKAADAAVAKAEQAHHDKEGAATEAKRKLDGIDDAIAQLADGLPQWEALASDYGVTCTPIPLAPGETNEDFGHEAPAPEPEPDADADAAPKEPAAPKTAAEKEQEDRDEAAAKQREKDQLLAKVSEANRLPPAERDKKLAELAKQHHVPVTELSRRHQAAVQEARDQVAAQKSVTEDPGFRSKTPAQQAEALGVPLAAYQAMQAADAHEAFKKRAAAALKLDDPEAALAKLYALGQGRGKTPEQMLEHLAHVDPEKLPPELQDLARNARAAERARIDGIADPQARAEAEKQRREAATKADEAEKAHGDELAIAERLKIDPAQASAYVDRLVATAGCSRADAIAALKANGGKGELFGAALQKELQRIHALPEAERAAGMAKLATRTDPKALAGITMAPADYDPDGIVDGPLGNEQLQAEIARINGLPKDQQWKAWQDLARTTGQDVKALYVANKHRETKQKVRGSTAAILNDPRKTAAQKEEALAKLAEQHHTTPEALRAMEKRCVEETDRRLAQSGTARDKVKDLDERISKGLDSGKPLTPEEIRTEYESIAKETGIPLSDLLARHERRHYERKTARWGKQLGKAPAEAADLVAKEAQEKDIDPDQVVDFLAYADPADLTAEERALRLKARAALKDTPEQKAREKAGLGAEEVAKTVPSDTEALALRDKDPRTAEEQRQLDDYDEMQAASQEIEDELDDVSVDEAEIVKRFSSLPPHVRAALLRRNPTLSKRIRAELANDDQEDEDNKKLSKAFEAADAQAKAHNDFVARYGGSDGGKDARQQKEAWARQVSRDHRACVKASEALHVPLAEGRAHLKAFAAGRGGDLSEAASALTASPDRSAREVLAEAYAATTEGGAGESPSPALKARLAAIDTLPPDERKAALDSLRGLSGLSGRALGRARKQIAREQSIATAVHGIAELPPEARDKALAGIAKEQGLTVEQVQQVYRDSLAATAGALPPAAAKKIDAFVQDGSGHPDDVAKLAKAIAAETGQDAAEIQRLIERRRNDAFAATGRKMFPPAELDKVQTEAANLGKTPEQLVDLVARTPRSIIAEKYPELLSVKDAIPDSYRIRYSDAEKARNERVSGLGKVTADDLGYRQHAEALDLALSAEDDTKVKEALQGMSLAERALYREEYEARRKNLQAASDAGKDVDVPPPLSDALDDALWDNDVGASAMQEAKDLAEQPDPLAALRAVDPADPAYQAHRKALTAELSSGSPDADEIKAHLAGMSLAERAKFLEEYKQLQLSVAQANIGDDDHQLPDLKAVLAGDAEASRMLVDADRVLQSGAGQADAKQGEQIFEQARVAKEAAVALKLDRRQAWSLVSQTAKDQGLSPANALRFVKGEPLQPETAEVSDYVSSATAALKGAWGVKTAAGEDGGDKVGGFTLSEEKVSKKAEQLQAVARDPSSMTPMQLRALLQTCNPRELAEIDQKLGGKLLQHIENAYLAYGERAVVPDSVIELRGMVRRMDAFAAEAQDLAVLDQLNAHDPRRLADPRTPEGFAERLAWARELPPEQRIAAMNALREQAGPLSARTVMARMLTGGPPGMLGKSLLGEMDRIRTLPADERAAALAALGDLVGRDGADLELDAAQTRKSVDVAKRVAEFDAAPDRAEKLAALAEELGLSEAEVEQAYGDAVTAGLVDRQVAMDKATAEALERIKRDPDPVARHAALEALAEKSGLTFRDLAQHLTRKLEDDRRRRAESDRAASGADKLAEHIRKGNGDKIKQQFAALRDKPDELKRLVETFGADALKEALQGVWDADSAEYQDVAGQIDLARAHRAEPALPSGVDPALSRELRRLRSVRRRGPAGRPARRPPRPLRQRPDRAEAHADWAQAKSDAEVAVARHKLEAEVRNGADGARIAEILQGMAPDAVLALDAQLPEGLVGLLAGVADDDTLCDAMEQVRQARMVASMPVERQAEALQDARVLYKADQLRAEFDEWVSDDDRIAALLKDCTPEELRRLDVMFEGKLEKLVDANTGGPTWGNVVGLVAFAVLGPIAGALSFSTISEWVDGGDQSTARAVQAVQARMHVAMLDPEAAQRLDPAQVDDALAVLQEQLVDDLWTSDGAVIDALKYLSPRELEEVRRRFDERNGGNGELWERLRNQLGGDAHAQAIAIVTSAEEAAAGIDRGAQMRDRCRELAVKDRVAELKRDPANAGRSEAELYELANRDPGRIDALAAERVKKIQDTANQVFQAVDGWWNNDTDAMLKSLAGLSAEEAQLVKIEYRRHFGRDMMIDLRDEMGFYNREEMAVAEKLLSDRPEVRVEGLRALLLEDYRMFDTEDEQMVFSTLEGMSVEERTLLVTGPEGETFLARLKADLGDNEQHLVDALTALDPETGKATADPVHVAAAKIKMHMHGSGDWWDLSAPGTKEEELVAELSKLTPAQVRELALYYDTHLAEGGSTFVADLESELSGRELQIVRAELIGDKVGADAQRLKWAAQEENTTGTYVFLALAGPVGWVAAGLLAATDTKISAFTGGTDEDLIEEVLTAGQQGVGGRDAAHLKAVRERFNRQFGAEGGRYAPREAGDARDAFDRFLADECKGVELEYFSALGRDGKASDELTLLYALQGLGSDETKANAVFERLSAMSPEDRERFRARFEQLSRELVVNQSLDDWIEEDLSGTELLQAQILMMGEPQTPEEKLRLARMRYEFERGSGNAMGNLVMDALGALGGSSAGDVLDHTMAELELCFGPDGKLLPGMEGRFEELAAWQEMDIAGFRTVRDSVADAVSNTVVAVASIAVIILTGGAAAAGLSLLFAAMGTAMKVAIKGNGSGWEDQLMELANLGVQAAMAAVGPAFEKLGELAAKAMDLGKILQKVFVEAAKGAVESLLQALVNSEQALEQGDVAFFQSLLRATAVGAFKGAVSGAVEGLLDGSATSEALERIEDGNPLAHSALRHFSLNYAKEVVQAGAGMALDPDNWEAWANGKELTLADVRTVLIDTAIQALAKTIGTRRKGLDPAKLESDARADAEKTRGALETLEAQRDDLDPEDVAGHQALDAQVAAMKELFAKQKQRLEWIVEDNQAIAEAQAARARVEAAVDGDAGDGADGGELPEDAGRTQVMRDLLEHGADEVLDEPIPPTLRPEQLARLKADEEALQAMAARILHDEARGRVQLDDDVRATLEEAAGIAVRRVVPVDEPVEVHAIVDVHGDPELERRQLALETLARLDARDDEAPDTVRTAPPELVQALRREEFAQLAEALEATEPELAARIGQLDPARPVLTLGDAERARLTPGQLAQLEANGVATPDRHPGTEPSGRLFEGQVRRLDSTDRVIERDALAMLRDRVLDDAQAALAAGDRDAAERHLDDVARMISHKEGQEPIAKAILSEADVGARLQAARDLNAMFEWLDADPMSLPEEGVHAIARGLYHLQKEEIRYLEAAASGAPLPDLQGYKRVVPMKDLQTC